MNILTFPLDSAGSRCSCAIPGCLKSYPTAIDSKLARLLNFASMGDVPPTDGAQLFARLSQGVAERASAVDDVERDVFAAVMELTGR